MPRENRGLVCSAFPVSICVLSLAWLVYAAASPVAAAPVVIQPPESFPQFVVPGHEKAMERMRQLYWLHFQHAGPLITLWDEWMPMSTLWPAMGSGRDLESMRHRWATALAGRGMNAEGYVHTHQHDGLAHAEGWPFPLWTQGGGIGWHFRGTGIGGYDGPPATPKDWKLTGATDGQINDKGWVIELTTKHATIATPGFAVNARLSPWLRLNWWAEGLENANCYVEWTTQEQPEFSIERRCYFSPTGGQKLNTEVGETRTMIPLYRLPGWTGVITGVRIGFGNAGPAKVVIKSFHTAFDSRHNINNINLIRGSCDYFTWSKDYTFMRGQIGRLRSAMRFIMREFDTRNRKCIYTTWVGHEGRSGVRYDKGKKVLIPGEGIGSNYWDLMPFGGEDSLASMYYYDALLDLAELEALIAAHPEWNISTGADAFDPVDLRSHAQEVKSYGNQRFWNPETGRLGTRDLEGRLYDYGWTFLNNEAIYYDFVTDEQARSIRAWISGRRLVEGDTSQGPDIYHWRFGPRSSTLRNLDYYLWAWSNPESIPWGGQVQDGGAVLGWSFHDLMARLTVDGPDDAWQRLSEILDWFAETQEAGGYREYYKDPARGTMQGGNVAGGLGLDREFFESILVPQVMIYGFLGFKPTAEGCEINPRLPSDWPSLTITGIHLHTHILDITARSGVIEVVDHRPGEKPLSIKCPSDWKVRTKAAK